MKLTARGQRLLPRVVTLSPGDSTVQVRDLGDMKLRARGSINPLLLHMPTSVGNSESRGLNGTGQGPKKHEATGQGPISGW